MELVLKVSLPADRTSTGTLKLVHPGTGLVLFGPVPILGRAARRASNPSGDSLQPWGDTPTGNYDVPRIVGNGAGTTRPVDRFGQSGSIVLEPTGGDALTAKKNGRIGLLIHAGRHPFSSVVGAQALKSTNGCIRMLDFDMAQLITVIKNNALVFPGKVTVEVEEPGGPRGDIDDSIDDGDPPPLQDGPIVLP